jgi:hypothetical protein
MTRFIGPSRSGRRRRTVFGALATFAILSVMIAQSALAVHDLEFQLEGDVDSDTVTHIGGDPPGSATQELDWEDLFSASGTELPLPPNFTASGFEPDFQSSGGTFITADTTTFATGSKDTLPISPGWQCNFDNNVNSKIDVMNAYAAEYVDPVSDDEVLYFALERNTNTGDANVGFWFLQDEVGCESTGGSAAFVGDHQDGDLLIVSAFTKGGDVSTIDVYRWNDPDPLDANEGSLGTTPVAHGVDCRSDDTTTGDLACAAANTIDNGVDGTIQTPWPTANFKDGVGNSLRTGEFFEGGLNLTDANLGGRCFNTFLGDTRSSQSLTATLFDFAGGQLGACESGIVTTPSVSTVSIGSGSVDVFDSADVTVDGTDTWSGTVSFFICGPIAAPATCDTGGLQIGSAIAVNQDTVMPVDSDDATLTSVGRYCWRGFFDSATDGVDDATDATTGECFTVTPVTPTLTTQAGADVFLGSPITDTATLSGTATQPGTNGPNATYPTINATNGLPADGTITWTVRGPNNCTDSGLTVSGSPATVSGDNTYGPVSATPTAVGDYTFVATYSGSSPNTLGAGGSCPPGANDGDEVVTVGGSASLTTAQRWLPNDTAHITSQAGTTLSGDVTFTLYNTADCTGTAQYGPVTIDVATGTGSANDRTVSTDNTTFLVTVANDGTAWSWKVSYNDDNLQDPADKCETTTPAFTLSD